MENNVETTQGDHLQVLPGTPPDQGVTQPNGVPVSEAHVLKEATSEDEPPMTNAGETQPSAAAKKRGKSTHSTC